MRRHAAAAIAAGVLIAGAATTWRIAEDDAKMADGPVASPEAPPSPTAILSSSPAGARRERASTLDEATADEVTADERDEPGTGERAGGSSVEPSANGLVVHVTARGEPVPDATVRVRSLKATSLRPTAVANTDAEGFARFPGTKPDLDEIAVETLVEGFQVARAGRGQSRNTKGGVLEVRLEPGFPLDGRVVDDLSGAPVPGASVVVFDWGNEFEVGPTDAAGRFHVAGIKSGSDHVVQITAGASGHAEAALRVVVDDDRLRPDEALLRLPPGGSVRGVVRSADGKPVAGARVIAYPTTSVAGAAADFDAEGAAEAAGGAADEPSDAWIGESCGYRGREHVVGQLLATSESDGSFRVDGLRLDVPYEARACALGHARSAPVDVAVTAAEEERSIAIPLRRPAVVTLRVVLADGAEPPSDADAWLSHRGPSIRRERSPGSPFRYVDLEPGTYKASADAEGYKAVAQRIQVHEGESLEVALVLHRGAVVDGTVVNLEGHPLPYAEVQIAPAADNRDPHSRYLERRHSTHADEQGRFSFTGLPAEPFVLCAESRDSRRWEFFATPALVPVTGPTRDVCLRLVRLASARMQLLTADGQPLVGRAYLQVARRGGEESGFDTQLSDGVAAQDRLDDGVWTWRVWPDFYSVIEREFTIRDGQDVDLGDVVVERGAAVSGRVSDRAGKPVEGAGIRCREKYTLATKTDAEGRFRLFGLPRERVPFSVSAEGFWGATYAVDSSRATSFEWTLSRPATLEGVVRRSDGRPASRATVLLRPKDAAAGLDEGAGTRLEVARDGRFVRTFEPGRYLVVWTRDGREQPFDEVELADGERRSVVLTLPVK